MINPGAIQSLPVVEIVDKGYLLGDNRSQVFISKRELKPGTEIGTEIEVFTYYNENRELEATTRLPEIQVGEVGCFRVRNQNDLGAFIDIGSKRDILIPAKEQVESLEEGRMTLVILLEDAENKRLYASSKLQRHLRHKEVPYKRGDEVTMMIAEKIDIGRRVVVDGKYIAALFRQEMTDKVRLGEKVKGFVRKVEGKDITVSMQREGVELLEDSKSKLLAYLEQNGGYVRLNDDTDPEEIKLRLHMSKKAFKKAAGMLYKEGKVLLTKFGVKLNKTGVVPDGWQKNKIFEDDETPPAMTPEKKREPRETAPRSSDRPKRNDDSVSERKPFVKREEKRDDRDSKRSGFVKKDFHEKRDDNRDSRRDERNNDSPKPKPKKELTFKGRK